MESSSSAEAPVPRSSRAARERLLPGPLAAALDRIDLIITVLCSALMAGMFGVVIWAVFCRYVLNSSLMWGEELARYLSIWMIALGLGLAHRRGAHVAVNSVFGWIPHMSKRTIGMISELTTLMLCILVCWFSWLAAQGNFLTGQRSPAMGIDIAWIYLAIPVGFLLMAVQSAIRLVAPDQYRAEQEVV
jgi:TRAP-type C4-dicarboxylate transport system permease small subunit